MTVMLNKYGLGYLSVPKVACTSIKAMMFEVENGFPFRPYSFNGQMRWIHNLYPSIPFSGLNRGRLRDLHRITVVRDPIKRALSCYSNRVVQHRELSAEIAGDRLAGSGLPLDPDLPTFVRNIDQYSRLVAEIGHHTAPLTEFLGRDPGYFHRIYRFDELPEMVADVRRITGQDVALEVMQRSSRSATPDQLSAEEIAILKDYYAEDYAIFGAYF